MNELIDACTAVAERYINENNAVMAVLHLKDVDEYAGELLEGIPEEALLEAIQESLESSTAHAWITGIVVDEDWGETRVSAIGEKISTTMSEWQQSDWKWVLKDLYQHPKASRYLDPLTDELIKEIANEAIPKIHKAMRAGE